MSLKKIIWLLLVLVFLTAMTVLRETGKVDVNLMHFTVDSETDASHENDYGVSRQGVIADAYTYDPVRVQIAGEGLELIANQLQSALQEAGIRGDFNLEITQDNASGMDILPMFKWGSHQNTVNLNYTMSRDSLITSGESSITITTDYTVRGIASSRNARAVRQKELSRVLSKSLLDHINSLEANAVEG